MLASVRNYPLCLQWRLVSLTVFPCHATADAAMARELADFLRAGAGVTVFLEEGRMAPDESLFAKVADGMMAEVLLVLLSPHSSPPRWVLDEWRPVFLEDPKEAGVALATVLVEECRFPELLRRKDFFSLAEDRLDGFRRIKRWLLELRGPVREPRFVPGRVHLPPGEEDAVDRLQATLADSPGRVTLDSGISQTLLALEFARRFGSEFEDVFWLAGQGRTAAALVGDLASQLGLKLDGQTEENAEALGESLRQRRYLLVLDSLAEDQVAMVDPGGRASVLAVRPAQAAPATVPELANLSAEERRLLEVMAVCAPGGFLLPLAAQVALMDEEVARETAAHLLERGLVAPLDRDGNWYYLPSPLRRALRPSPRLARRHARNAGEFAAVQHAFAWALAQGADEEAWELARSLGRRGIARARQDDRLAEAYEMAEALYRAAECRQDRRALEEGSWEMIWILERWDRLDEAQDLDQLRRSQYADQMCFEF